MASTGIPEKIGAAFGIKKGEFIITFSLFLYLLLVIASYVVSKTVRDSLFLTKFGALKLPYVYIGIAVLVSLFVSIYIKIAHRIKQHVLLSLILLFFISNVVLFWWLFQFQFDWLYPVIYIWAGIFGVIAPMQVWTLSNFMLTTRQAKRLYGFIGSGGILGGIAGGFFSSWMVPLIGTENLLLSIAGCLVICILLVNLIWFTSAKTTTDVKAEPHQRRKESPSNLRQSLFLLTQSRYLLLIAGIISVASIATTIVDYQFKAVAQDSFDSKDELTAFFGNFYGYLGIGAFLLQIFLTSRMMRKLGIGVTIFLLPAGLLLGSIPILAYVTLWSATLLKGPDQLFKHSIDRSTIELLYLPVPTYVKAAVKSVIDTVIWRLADGTAGLILLFLTSVIPLNVRQISLVNIFFLIFWVAIAYVTKREYVNALRSAISRRDVDPEKITINIQDPSTITSLITSLHSADTNEVLYVLHLIDSVKDKKELVPHLKKLMDHDSPAVRAKVLNVLFEVGDEQLAEKVKGLLADDSPEVQVEAINFICAYGGGDPMEMMKSFLENANYKIRGAAVCCAVTHHREGEYYVVARKVLEEMLRSKDETARREAARTLGGIKGPSALHNALIELLQDPAAAVVQQALESAGKVQRREFVPLLIAHLRCKDTQVKAREALVKYGTKILGTLRDYLMDDETDSNIRMAIPRIISQIGSQEAVDILTHNLYQKDPQLRLMVIKGLNKLRVRSSELRFPAAKIREPFINDVKECYRMLALLQAYNPEAQWPFRSQRKGDLLQYCLEEKLETVLERIFRLLGLIYPPEDLYRAYHGILSDNLSVRTNALELLDNLLEPDDKKWVLPIIEEAVSMSEKAKVGESLGVFSYRSKVEALAHLFEEHDPLIVLCTIDAVHTHQLEALYEQVQKATHHAHPLVRETAEKVWTLIEDSKQAARSAPGIHIADRKRTRGGVEMNELTTLEKMKYLQNVDFLAQCKVDQLVKIAAIVHEVTFQKGDVIFRENDPGDSLYCIVDGKVRLKNEGTSYEAIIGEGATFGTLAMLDRKPRAVTAVAEEDITALRIGSEDFYDLLADHIEIVQGIFSLLTQEIRNYMGTGEMGLKSQAGCL